MKTVCVYGILNVATKKWYVGSSVDFNRRRATHLRDLKRGTHTGVKLLRAWKKYGEVVWEWHILEVVTPGELLFREQHWLDHHNSYHGGYNSLPFVGRSRLGVKQSPATIAKRVATRRGNDSYHHTAATRAKIGNTQRGMVRGAMPVEQRELLSKVHTSLVTATMRKACGDRARGRDYTPEMRERMAEAHRGKVGTQAQKDAVSKALKGKPKDVGSIRKALLQKRGTLGIHITRATCTKYGIEFIERGSI